MRVQTDKDIFLTITRDMKKIFTLASICSAFVLASCAGNSANNAANEVEGEIETVEIVEVADSTVAVATDSTTVAIDTTATK